MPKKKKTKKVEKSDSESDSSSESSSSRSPSPSPSPTKGKPSPVLEKSKGKTKAIHEIVEELKAENKSVQLSFDLPKCKHVNNIKFQPVKKEILNPSKWACFGIFAKNLIQRRLWNNGQYLGLSCLWLCWMREVV